MKNKNSIRLTESDLHRIVKESVNKVLNEIGDKSRKYQGLLGALSMRKGCEGDLTGEKEVDKYANAQQVDMFKDMDGSWSEEDSQNAYNLNTNLRDAYNQGRVLMLKYYMVQNQYKRGDIDEEEYRKQLAKIRREANKVPEEKYFDLKQQLKSMGY